VTTDSTTNLVTTYEYDERGRIQQQTLKGINSSDDRNTIYTYNDSLNLTTLA
jgi:YD repeat-containing protein